MGDVVDPPPNSQYPQYKFSVLKFPTPEDVPFSEAALEDIKNNRHIKVPIAKKFTFPENSHPEKNGVKYSTRNKLVYKTSGSVTLEDGKEYPLTIKLIFEKLKKVNSGNGKSRYIEVKTDIENGRFSKKCFASFFYIDEGFVIGNKFIDKGLLPCENYVEEDGFDQEDYRRMMGYLEASLSNIVFNGVKSNGLVIPYENLNGGRKTEYNLPSV